jgi:signal transduction histidine kinase
MPLLLLVADQAESLDVLHANLRDSGHELVDARSTDEALALALQHAPDLVVCDVTGAFETVRRLKEQRRDELLPVVLVTAAGDAASRQEGLRAGADGFLSRPVDGIELVSCIDNLVALREHRQALARKALELAELRRFRDEMSAMIVHDLEAPLAIVMGRLDKVAGETLTAGGASSLGEAQYAARRIALLLANLVDVARLEAEHVELHRQPITLDALLGPVIHPRRRLADARDLRLVATYDPHAILDVDPDLVSRVVENLIDNGLRHTPAGGVIEVSMRSEPGRQTLLVGNSGPPVPPESRVLIFEKFGRVSGQSGRSHLGLGLYFCRLVAEAHGGRLDVEESADLPTVFVLTLPS